LAIFYETTMCYNPEDLNSKQTVEQNVFHVDKSDLIDEGHSFVLGIYVYSEAFLEAQNHLMSRWIFFVTVMESLLQRHKAFKDDSSSYNKE
jgi:hypothetical protein